MTTIKSFTKNCTLVAVQEITRASDEDVIRTFKSNGWKENKGANCVIWLKCLSDLGMQYEQVSTGLELKLTTRKSRITGEVEDSWRYEGLTVGQVRKKFPEGTYLVTIRKHAFVIRDGRILDPNMGRGKTKAVVRSMYKITNAPIVTDEGNRLLFNRYPLGKIGPKRNRRIEAYEFCKPRKAKGRSPTLAYVLENTAYTQKDFDYDLAYGLVQLV